MADLKGPTDDTVVFQQYPLLDRELPFVATIEFLDTSLCGLRRSQSMGGILAVVAAPFLQLDRLKAQLPSASSNICYLVHGSVVYVGQGNGDRKIGERVAAEVLNKAQVYVLYSFDPRFHKLAAGYVEARLVDRLHDIGVPLANLQRPLGGNLNLDPGFEQLVRQAEFLLGVAGFRPLEGLGSTAGRPSLSLPATRILGDVVPIEPDQMPTPPATLYRLRHKGLQATGFLSGGKVFYVQPGADYALTAQRGMTEYNILRRKGLEQFLEPVPGEEQHRRLRVGLRCATLPIASKLLTGEHIGKKAWQVVTPDGGAALPV
ncbi:hypothetical protein ACFQX9_37635 [Bradyrhizobium sp. GCM10028915]|uniref:hypothetical protein n=1 Tax=Bradyrhizobium sp. GCM10028915 TaxID=3273385 RepID=UPI00361A0B8D